MAALNQPQSLLNLPTLATDLTAWLAAAKNASAKLRAWAAANPTNPAAATALAAADDIDAAASALDVVSITSTTLDELKALALAGRGIVHHQATDTF